MFSILKKNIWASAMLGGITVAALLLLVNSLIKGIFILSHESAVQKATPFDIVLGTLSLGLVLLAILGINGAVFLAHKRQEFDKHVILALLGAALLLIISGLLVVVKDHISYTTDWKKLNDIEGARANIASNLVIANTLVGDQFGNIGAINPEGTTFDAINKVVQTPKLLNSIPLADYDGFVNQVIQTKKDLAALYGVDELLNTAHQPLVAARLVDGLAAAWQADHTITASAWLTSKSNIQPYDFLSIVRGFNTADVDTNTAYNSDVISDLATKPIKTVGIAGDEITNKILSGMQRPLVFTGITTAYLQGFPITITGIALTAASVVPYGVTTLLDKKGFAVRAHAPIKKAGVK